MNKHLQPNYQIDANTGGGHTIQDEGTPLTSRANLNFVGTGVTVTDDSGTNSTVVTITSGGGSGTVDSVVAGNNIDVDATDPANPIVSVETLTLADISDVTPTATELNYVDGVTSAIQTQIDGKVSDTGDSMTGQLNIGLAGNALIARNTTDNASVQVAIFEGDRATMADNDEAYITLRLSDDAGTQTEFARIGWRATDVNVATSVDGALEFYTNVAGVLTKQIKILGNNSLGPNSNDQMSLGVSGTAFSDLFLASGAVINFNAGNATLTHSANLLTSNVDVSVPDEAYDATAWNGSLEVPTKNAIRDKIESLGAGYTDEQAQDAVGNIMTSSERISFNYDDATPRITADINAAPGSIVTSDPLGLRLDGDDAGPGGSYYYGTNSGGTKGFFTLPASGGDVVGPASATDGYIALFDGTTGKLLKDGMDPASLGGTSNIQSILNARDLILM